MLIKKATGIEIPASEITPKEIYLSRRTFMTGAAALAATAALVACGTPPAPAESNAAENSGGETSETAVAEGQADELGDPLTSHRDVTNYNNYYEFTTDKEAVASKAAGFPTSPWQMEVDGMVRNPGVYDIEDLRGRFDQEERIYRMRCVEGWSMVIPWLGFPLSKLLDEVSARSIGLT